MIYEEFLEVNRQAFWVQLRTGFTFAGIFPILITIAGLGTGLLVSVGVQMAQNQVLTAGEWYLFIQGLELFWFPLTSIASFWSQFQLGLAAGERVFALLDADAKVQQTGKNLQPDHFKGEIEFKHMNFEYKEDEPVLRNFSLTIGAGETLALVGHTGSGKSSIGKLIARFYEYQGGQLLIDGNDIRDLDLAHFRAALGVVTQTPFLFEGTVMDNIRYGRQDFIEDDIHLDGYRPGANSATDAEVIAVAERIAGGDWLKFLPEGLQTEVGERGSNLSIGQRQLVALARVILQDPRILILDEATASVDPLTEGTHSRRVRNRFAGRTAIVIAHRLSTIKSADRIIVLKRGVSWRKAHTTA
jgi:ABC-type multidrug transport system fused ATPase/permease subunit